MMMPRTGFALAPLMLLGACGGGEEVNNSGVTPEEAVALDEAAEMLDAPSGDLEPAEENVTDNGDMPVEEGANTGDLPVTDLGGSEGQ